MTWNLAWGLGLVVVALALGALRADLGTLSRAGRVWKAVRVLLLALGLAVALNLVPIPHPPVEAPPLSWRTDVENALAEARAQGRMAILDAGAEWCAACQELEHRTLQDPAVIEALKDFVAIRIDMTDFDAAQRRLEALGIEVSSLPYVAFFLPDGRQNPGVTLRDYEAPSAFLRRVSQAETWQEERGGPVAHWLAERGILWAMLLALLAGIGVSLTPCVYPMIPVTLGVLGARGNTEGPPPSLGDRVGRAAVFVLGMVLTYATLGVASALLGKGFGSWIQHPVVTLAMATLFAALALSYLGFFSLDLPEGLKARLGARRGGLLGLALVGGTTGLLAAPCAGPVVVGILAVVSATQSVGLGFALMLAFGMGLGLLFFVLGVSSALVARRPRSGPWMERIELGLATGLLVVALYYGRLGLGL